MAASRPFDLQAVHASLAELMGRRDELLETLERLERELEVTKQAGDDCIPLVAGIVQARFDIMVLGEKHERLANAFIAEYQHQAVEALLESL